MHRSCCVCHAKLFIKSVSDHFSVDFLGKGECFNLNHTLGCLPFSIHHNLTSRSSLSFHLSDLLSLFIILPPLMLAALWECNVLLLMTLGKTRNLPKILERSRLLLLQGGLT